MMMAVRDLGSRNRPKAETNPIQRGSIEVSGTGAELYMFVILGSGGGSNASERDADGRVPRIKAGEHAAEIRFLGSEVQRLQRVVTDTTEQSALTPSSDASCSR